LSVIIKEKCTKGINSFCKYWTSSHCAPSSDEFIAKTLIK
jgi:hypothetical protein